MSDSSINTPFRTPFFEIEIGGPNDKKLVPLSPQLLRLVERIEITETMGNDCLTNLVFNITFREGSREPYDKLGSLDKEGLYSSTELLSNTTGMLADLRIVKGSGKLGTGIKIIADAADVGAKVLSSGTDIINAQTGIASAFDGGVDIEFDKAPKVNPGVYLFGQNNQVKITWGYKDRTQKLGLSHRSIRGFILNVSSNFPENGHPATTITCNGTDAILERYSPTVPKRFAKKTITGEYEPMSTKEIFEQLTKLYGVKFVVSNELIQDEAYIKVWPSGQTLMEFLKKLAREHHAYLAVKVNENAETTVFLVNRKDYDAIEIKEDKNLFNYKQPGSIIKSIDIKADMGIPIGAAIGSTTDKGNLLVKGSEIGSVATILFDKSEPVADGNPLNITESINKDINPEGKSNNFEVVPGLSERAMYDRAKARGACMNKGPISLDFVCLGLPSLRPITVRFGGIGKRYSGPYKVIAVTHVLDMTGYLCKGNAIVNLDYGKTNDSAGDAKKGNIETKESQLFQSATLNKVLPENIGKARTGVSSNSNDQAAILLAQEDNIPPPPEPELDFSGPADIPANVVGSE